MAATLQSHIRAMYIYLSTFNGKLNEPMYYILTSWEVEKRTTNNCQHLPMYTKQRRY